MIKANQGKLIAIICLGVIWALAAVLRGWTAGMDFLVTYITAPLRQGIAWICSFLPFSAAELIWAVTILGGIIFVVKSIVELVKARGRRAAVAVRKALVCVVFLLAWAVGFTVLLGAQFYTTPFEEKAGLKAQEISVQQLADTMQYFADKLNETALLVPRDKNGVFAAKKADIIAQSMDIYDALEQQYPFLAAPHYRPKSLFTSRLFSYIDFTGFYFPFTGEANVNTDAPACLLPATIAHEQAHQHSISPEQTCNLLAVLACVTSGNSLYEYSGYLMGYIHLSNALITADTDTWRTVAGSLCSEVNADLADNNAYWKQFDTPVQSVSNAAYDKFLKGYDQALGMKSYGAVVDLLVAYYKDII